MADDYERFVSFDWADERWRAYLNFACIRSLNAVPRSQVCNLLVGSLLWLHGPA